MSIELRFIWIFIVLNFRLEKEYTVIRKEEQEEQIEIRVCIFS